MLVINIESSWLVVKGRLERRSGGEVEVVPGKSGDEGLHFQFVKVYLISLLSFLPARNPLGGMVVEGRKDEARGSRCPHVCARLHETRLPFL